MYNALTKLKKHGYVPDTVLDIGACYGNWTRECLNVFPTTRYLLFEPIQYPQLYNLERVMPNVEVHNVLLDSKEGEATWYERQNTGDSMFRERTFHFENCPPVMRKTTPLRNIVDDKLSSMNNVLIKIDCQGAEIPILKGAGDILQKTDFILLEMPFFGQYNENVPGFLEHIKYMDDIGYIPFDMVETHNMRNFTIQVDILFISKTHSLNETVQTEIFR